ncbi:MAG TPA: VOC family protein [Pelagibacterium sp.]|uniref:VOC family protein n=1 Tax=Pelagibacterium sp. TaxID=1967288 RepID=UPI002C31A2CD|nr:VOC family protein [Pelagibacterium sp.]HWJ86530.1 VOC family protein [Pelagibacterium sp.]
MDYHVGRLIDHIHLRVADLERSRAFYRAVLAALGRELTYDGEKSFASDELYVDAADDYVTRVHLAFQADGPEMVARFYEAALAAGAKDNGTPGERPYHRGYYACFVLDPDGNNIEAVWHGPSTRSAASVVFHTPDEPA